MADIASSFLCHKPKIRQIKSDYLRMYKEAKETFFTNGCYWQIQRKGKSRIKLPTFLVARINAMVLRFFWTHKTARQVRFQLLLPTSQKFVNPPLAEADYSNDIGDFCILVAHLFCYYVKAINALYSCLGDAGLLSTTPRWGNPAKCLSERHNKQTCRLVFHTFPLKLNVKQGSCEYQF